ncbi:MAG: hypothetical protein ACXW2G_06650 [Burkholderiaceae bacterium]
MNSVRSCLTALPFVLLLAACSDSPRPYGDRTTTPPSSPAAKGEAPTMTPPSNTAAPATAAPAPSSAAPVLPPSAAEDVDAKKGSETGMVGGASGTAASGGKPGANMPGSGEAAQTTGEPTKSSK